MAPVIVTVSDRYMETNEIVNSQEREPLRGLGDGYENIPQLSKNQLGVISYSLLVNGLKGMASFLYVTDDRNIKSGCHPISNND